jgi:hypothetical protein
MTFLEEFQFVMNYVPGKEMAVANLLSRRPDHEEGAAQEQEAASQERNITNLHYHAVDKQEGRWIMETSLFEQVYEEYGPFDNDAFSDERTAQLNSEGEKDFYQT